MASPYSRSRAWSGLFSVGVGMGYGHQALVFKRIALRFAFSLSLKLFSELTHCSCKSRISFGIKCFRFLPILTGKLALILAVSESVNSTIIEKLGSESRTHFPGVAKV